MTQPYKGIYIPLPLTPEMVTQFVEALGGDEPLACDAIALGNVLDAIGTPVAGGELTSCGSVKWYQDEVDPILESYNPQLFEIGVSVRIVTLAYHQAALAAAQAEIVRLRAENDKMQRIAYSGRGTLTHTIHSPARFADEERKALKDPEA